ncbi:hypothetical protein CMMCA002_06730 [Clavibacter michiganensis subsp. michiganensis]|nr:hypothetical protein CMMCA002_06730 [Clavibacter michiganensis subsp. michiganensis]
MRLDTGPRGWGVRGDARREPRAVGAARDVEAPAGRGEPTPHAVEAVAAGRARRVEPAAVVADHEHDVPAVAVEDELHGGGVCVAAHIGEALLGAAEEDDLGVAVDGSDAGVGPHLDRDACLAGQALAEPGERLAEAVRELHGRRGRDDRAGLRQRVPRALLELGEGRPRRVGVAAAELAPAALGEHDEPGEVLRDRVVDVGR